MNLDGIPAEPLFECADGIERRPIWNGHELRQAGRQALNFPEVIGLIGGNPNRAARDERPIERSKKALRHDSARRMAPLRPGIGKH